ncbi:MAG: carboxymuconolactone decarboxylase family protein [Myxococcaceae bacterium]|nr:carboxymuconolactone decarboxylase family protein [Myxococcaceae bacterium]
MENIDKLRESFPDAARDIKINLQNVLQPGTLSLEQTWGVAISCAWAARNRQLTDALVADAKAKGVPDAVLEDAKAAAIMMGMNNVYYRFRHVIGKESYEQKPARLRMLRLKQPASNQVDFELFSAAVSSVNFCEACLKSHEAVVLEGGLTEDHVHDAIRIAATVNAAAVALEAV